MERIIVEVGSTVTKVDGFDGKRVSHLDDYVIHFKNNFKKENKLNEQDVEKLIENVKILQEKYKNVYVCGTSIFRVLTDEQRNEFLDRFKSETGIDFDIISQEKENEYTVIGATQKVNQKVAVFVGGGGSTEIAVYDNGIKEMVNTPIGVIDIKTRIKDTERYYKEISLDEIRAKVNDPDWWYATRAMTAFVLVVAEKMGIKYIVPTDVSMVYGLLK